MILERVPSKDLKEVKVYLQIQRGRKGTASTKGPDGNTTNTFKELQEDQ